LSPAFAGCDALGVRQAAAGRQRLDSRRPRARRRRRRTRLCGGGPARTGACPGCAPLPAPGVRRAATGVRGAASRGRRAAGALLRPGAVAQLCALVVEWLAVGLGEGLLKALPTQPSMPEWTARTSASGLCAIARVGR